MKLDKILKQLDKDTVEAILRLDQPEIKDLIVQSEEAIAQATRERDANPHYQAARQAVKDLSEGLRDVKKRQTAKIAYALRRLRELNGEVLGDEE